MGKILCVVSGMTDPHFHASDYSNLSFLHLQRYVDTTQGREPESLGCLMRLLGIKKVPAHLQGYVEALGNEIPVGTNDLVMRGSWFSLDNQGCCTVPVSVSKQFPEMECCRYYPLGESECLLVFPGMASFLSDMVTNPPYLHGEQNILELCPKGCSKIAQVFLSQLTKEHCMMLWGQSVPAHMPPFPQKTAVICGTSTVKGMARLLGMTLLPVSGATGDVDTDLQAKAKAAIEAAKTYPLVLLHINGGSAASYRRNPDQKRAFLEKFDSVVLPLLIHSGCEITVVSDYCADPVTGQHLGKPQPLFTNAPGKVIRKKSDITEEVLRPANTTEAQRKNWAIKQLQRKAKELGRLPKKADFGDVDIIRIKTALGPWPRALEAAGLKERKEGSNS